MSNNKQSQNDDSDNEVDEQPQIPYRRDRTPSIVVQSLGLTFKRDPNITGSVELPGDDSTHQDLSPTKSESAESTGSNEDLPDSSDNSAPPGSPKNGSSSALRDSSSPSPSSPKGFSSSKSIKPPSRLPSGVASDRRLSLNIGSTAPRRQSLTVEGLSSDSLASAAAYKSGSSGSATGSLRNKAALKPGHSLMGWIKLATTAQDLAGTGGRIIEVTPEELAKHNTEDDCWVALKGNVYNVTTYLHYHPGGVEELMRGAGRDATDLFNEVHRWVNFESILAKSLVGPYKVESPLTPLGRANFKTITDNTSKPKMKDPTVAQKPPRRQSIALTVPSPNKYQSLLLNSTSTTSMNQVQQPPCYVIMQDKNVIKMRIQDLTTMSTIRHRHIICDLSKDLILHVSVILSPDWLYRIHLRLDHQIYQNISVELLKDNKTITILLNKVEPVIWDRIGTSLDLNDSLCEMTLADKFFRPCRLINKQKLTHDTYLFEFSFDMMISLMYIPIGWHVLIKEHTPAASQENDSSADNELKIFKNYTPVLSSLLGHDGLTDESGFLKSLHFIIKIYPDGVLTSKLTKLKLGDMVDISDYQCVDFDIETLVRAPVIKHWFLLAAGTGITPFCRIIPYLLSQSEDLVESVSLLFFNKTAADIIWRDQFEACATKYNGRFKITHVLSSATKDTKGTRLGSASLSYGKVNKDLLSEHFDPKSPDEIQILACGPRAFTQLTKSIVGDCNLQEKLYIFHG